VLAVAGWSIVSGPPAWAGVTAGAAEITQPGQATPLRAGGSATPFGIALPPGARCPGDSAHRGYHVFSFLVPAGTSPATVRFTDIPTRGLGYFAGGVYVGALNTAEFTGQVVELPTGLSLARLTPTQLLPRGAPRATWEGGIACADATGTVSNYWDTTLVFTARRADPGGFTWSVTGAGAVISPGSAVPWVPVGLLVVAVALAAGAVAYRHRGSGEGRRVAG